MPSAGQPHRYIRGVTRVAKTPGCNLSGDPPPPSPTFSTPLPFPPPVAASQPGLGRLLAGPSFLSASQEDKGHFIVSRPVSRDDDAFRKACQVPRACTASAIGGLLPACMHIPVSLPSRPSPFVWWSPG